MEVPTIWKAYDSGLWFRGYTPNIEPYMVQYLHFRILEFTLMELREIPLKYNGFEVINNNEWKGSIGDSSLPCFILFYYRNATINNDGTWWFNQQDWRFIWEDHGKPSGIIKHGWEMPELMGTHGKIIHSKLKFHCYGWLPKGIIIHRMTLACHCLQWGHCILSRCYNLFKCHRISQEHVLHGSKCHAKKWRPILRWDGFTLVYLGMLYTWRRKNPPKRWSRIT